MSIEAIASQSTTASDYLDLCWNCNSSDECLSKKTLTRPIWFCEEFSVDAPKADTQFLTIFPAESKASAVSDASGENPTEYKGICMNCEHRQSCRGAVTDPPTWFCEEYA